MGGIAGSAHRWPPGVSLSVTAFALFCGEVVVLVLRSARPLLRALARASLIDMTGLLAGEGVGGNAGAAHNSSSSLVGWSAGVVVAMFAEFTISFQFIANGKFLSGSPWFAR